MADKSDNTFEESEAHELLEQVEKIDIQSDSLRKNHSEYINEDGMNGKVENLDGAKSSQVIATAAVNLAAIAAGIALGWPSPSLPKLKIEGETPVNGILNEEQESWVGSLVALGAALGPLPAGIGCDRMGRKMTLLIASAPFILAWFIIATTCNVTQIYAARFLMGIGVGAIFTALPMYVGEISEDSIRGSLGSFMQLFVTIGLLLAYAIGPYITFFYFALVCLTIPVVFAVVFWNFPESPYFLIMTGKQEEAKQSLHKLRKITGETLNKEINIIQESVDEAMSNKGSFTDILKNKGNLKALLLSLGLVAGQQLSGINVVLFYTENIFKATGSQIPPEICAIIIGVVQVLSSTVTPLVVEKLGRRVLLFISAAGMCLALFTLGLFFHLKSIGADVTNISFLPVASLVVYMIVYCVGFGPIPWAAMGELFPANIKSNASTATASFCWFLGFLITKFFSNIAGVTGMAGAFWIFSAFCILSGIFVYVFLPETKGKSLQQIQDELNGVKH